MVLKIKNNIKIPSHYNIQDSKYSKRKKNDKGIYVGY